MKHIALLVIMLCLCGSMLFAQTSFGARAGLNLSNCGGETNSDELDSKFGANAGMMLQVQLAPNLIVQPEFLYTMKGTKMSTQMYDSGYYFDVDFSDTYSYVEIPLLIKLSGQSGTVKFQPYLGPSVGVLMSAQEKVKVSLDGQSASETQDIKDYMNETELGINVGFDLVFKSSTMLGVRYNMGISNIFQESEGIQSKLKNRVWMFNFGYIFDLSAM